MPACGNRVQSRYSRIIVPNAIAMEALLKAEEIEQREQGMHRDLAAGRSFGNAFQKWGRA